MTRDLAAIPDDPELVCGLIAEFLESWNATSLGSVICSAESEVSAAEQRLGLVLPGALRWLLMHAGTDNAVVGRQDSFVHPRRIEVDEHGVMAYRVENQNCAAWGVRVEDLARPDPPVVWRDLQTNAEWGLYQERLSVDLLEMVFSETMLLPGACVLQSELSSGVPSELDGMLRLAIPDHVFWAIPDGPPVKWYGMEDCLIRNDGDVWLWVFGRTEEAVGQATEAISGQWERLQE